LESRLPRRVLPWPSYSPDLNPIENVWAVLKHNIKKRIKKIVAEKFFSLEKNVIVSSMKIEFKLVLMLKEVIPNIKPLIKFVAIMFDFY